jgi:hypothetical protein
MMGSELEAAFGSFAGLALLAFVAVWIIGGTMLLLRILKAKAKGGRG